MFARSCFRATRATSLGRKLRIPIHATRTLVQNPRSPVESPRHTDFYNEFEDIELPEVTKHEKDIQDVYALTEELLQKLQAYHAKLSKLEASHPDQHILNQMYDVRLRPILELRDMARSIIRMEGGAHSFGETSGV